MNRRLHPTAWGVLVLVLGMIVAACASAGGTTSRTVGPTALDLTVYAASSLKRALEAVSAIYERAHPGLTLTVATDASSSLRTQIEQGAPADVFLSADEQNPAALVEAGLTDGPAVDFAGNRLTIIVPSANPEGITTAADLAKAGVKIVAAGAGVPITTYASRAVANLARLPGFPADFAGAYERNVVSKEDNVKAVVAKIELGEGDAAIVYATDGMDPATVRTIQIPAGADVPATYSGAVVKTTPNAAAARAFLTWLAGPGGQAVLAAFGFLPPS